MSIPSWAKSMVDNWRRAAHVPETITDDMIFNLLQKNSDYDYYNEEDEPITDEEKYKMLRCDLDLEEVII